MEHPKRKLCLETKGKVARRIPENQLSIFSERCGVENSKLWRWLNSGGGLSYQEMFAVAKALNVTVDFLLDDEQRDNVVPAFPTTKYRGEVIRRIKKTVPPKKSDLKGKAVDKKPSRAD